jgi:hypothetical protein
MCQPYHAIAFLSFIFKLHTGTSMLISWQSEHVHSRTSTGYKDLHLKCLKMSTQQNFSEKWTLRCSVYCISWRDMAWIPKRFCLFCIIYWYSIVFSNNLSPYMKQVFVLLFHRLSSSRTTKFVKGLIVFFSLYAVKYGAGSLVGMVDSIQPE